MIPTPRTLKLGLLLAIAAILPSVDDRWSSVWLACVGGLLLLTLFDLLRLRRIKLVGNRDIRQVLAHRQWSPVAVHIDNLSPFDIGVDVHDMHPSHCSIRGLPQHNQLRAQQRITTHYQIQSNQRGDLTFEGIQCRVATRLGLWFRKFTLPANDTVKVFPNYTANKLFGLLLSRQHLDHLGIRRLPRPGEGNDFHQLREYRHGDSLKQIDWKATARTQKLITREYAQERDQQIVFLLDCSVRMRHRDQATSHIDDALNAVVLLAHVALQQGDATGLMTFGGVDRWISPAKGAHAARRLMLGLYDIEATLLMPDYVAAVQNLAKHLKRRALVILITNLRNEDGNSALQALRHLNNKHLVLMADLRETDLDNTTEHAPQTADEAVLWMSAEAYRQTRVHQHKLAVAGGARLLDVKPAHLSADLISRYLAIKRLGQL